jgi:hypothetical protein
MEGGISIKFLMHFLPILGGKDNLEMFQEENCCVPCEPDRCSTSAVSDQLHNHKHMNSINCTQRWNAFNWDMNAQW